MTGFSVLRSRLTGTLATPGDTDHIAGVDSTSWRRPDAVGRAASEADVVGTGRFARAEGRLNLRVRQDATAIPPTSGQPGGPKRDGFHRPNRPVGS